MFFLLYNVTFIYTYSWLLWQYKCSKFTLNQPTSFRSDLTQFLYRKEQIRQQTMRAKEAGYSPMFDNPDSRKSTFLHFSITRNPFQKTAV